MCNDIEESLAAEIYSQRLLVFLEDKPQSNKYRQIELDAKQFKVISDSISSVFEFVKKDEHLDIYEMKLSDELHTLPDLQQIHEVSNVQR